MKTLGSRVKSLREAYGMTQQEFALALGLKSYLGISKIENGQIMNPRPDTIDKMVNTLGTTKDFLLNGKGEMLPEGLIESKPSNDNDNPYRDYLIQRLEKEVETWKSQYDKVLDALLRGNGANLGKLLTLKVADKEPTKIIALHPNKGMRKVAGMR